MRAREYRLWDKVRKIMVTALDEPPYEVEIYIDGSFGVNWQGEKFGEIHAWCEHSRDYDLMDYTGKKDKDGAKIFEDDIVEVKYNTIYDFAYYQIIYDNDKAMFWKKCIALHHKDNGFKDISRGGYCESCLNTKCKLIGNIHENPELRGQAK